MKIKHPYQFEHPQIAGREEALTKLRIPSPSQHQVGKLFPNLVDIRLQRDRWKMQGYDDSNKTKSPKTNQGGISRQQMSFLEGLIGG